MANTQAQTISLTLEPYKEEETVEKAETEIQEVMSEDNLSEEERQMVESFAKQIDVANSEMILHYGAAAQTKMANFSETTLNSVKTKDLGEVGKLMTDLVGELKSIDEGDDDKGWNIFKKAKDKATTLKARYTSAENNVNHIVEILEGHQIQLMKDIAMLDEMYQMNLQNFKELSLYIIAGKKKLIQARDVELENLKKKAMASGLPEDSQAANDFASLCDRFEKKIHDLELTRTVALQMGPQIRLVQNNDILMTEKIQSSIVNTIPLWKSQMVLALGLEHSTEAMKAQSAVSEMTNQLLKKNAETLKMGSIGVAKESERGIIDIETLKQTNQSLISTLDEVMKIQDEGREKRRHAEQELARIEGELKTKLLDIRS
jgi:Uncharacterized protein involved in tellurite resistance